LFNIFFSLLLAICRNLAAQPVYTFGVVPQQSAIKTARMWHPLLDRLSAETGYRLEFHTAPSIPAFEAELAGGDYDFAYMNPYHYVHFHETAGYQAMAHEQDKKIHGLLVTRQDSGINSLADLEGQSLAFPAPAAFAASILPRVSLRQMGISLAPQYVNSHDSVYLNVFQRHMLAGGGVIRTLSNMPREYRETLKTLWKSPGFTPHAIAARSGLPGEVVARVTQALVALASTEDGQGLLASMKIKGWQAARDSDWDDVRALDIHLLDLHDRLSR